MVAGLSGLTLLMLAAPALITSPDALKEVVAEPRFARALLLSLASAAAAASIALALSVPVAYYSTRRGGRLARAASSLHLLLLGLPPVGLGLSLLILLRATPLRAIDEAVGVAFTVKGVVLAQSVAVAPLSISLVSSVFSYIPPTLEELARVYGARGARVYLRVLLPAAAPGLVGAWALSFFRALGEFGATLVLGGGAPWYTETLPIAMYNMLSIARVEEAAALMVASTLIGLAAVAAYAVLQGRLAEKARLLQGS